MIKGGFKILAALLLIPVVLLSWSSLTAAGAEQRVFDQAGLFSENEISLLESRITELKRALPLDIVIVTTADAEGKSSRDYADDFYDYGGFGVGAEHDGLLYLINMDYRECWISTTGAAIDIFTDARIDSILDDYVYPYLVEGAYFDSSMAFLGEIPKYVRQGVPEDQYRIDENDISAEGPATLAARFRRSLSNTPVYLFFSMFIGAVVVGIMAAMNRGIGKITATTYLDQNSTALVESRDNLINTRVRKTRIQPPSGGGSGGFSSGSRSTTHRSSSGRTHGGGGRKF